MPQAENTAAPTGTTTFLTPSSCASATACIPPPPPNATRVKSRGSKPRLTDTSLSALTMLLLAMRMMPRAASAASTPRFDPTASIARPAAAMSAVASPPQNQSRLMRPSHQVGVGRGGLGAASPVGGGTGNGSGRPRPDVKLAEVVDPCDRAPAGADLHEVDDRHQDRVPGRGPARARSSSRS